MAAGLSGRTQRFVVAGALFLFAWQAATLAGASLRTQVLLAVPGFVLHVVFGKAYALVPSYFERELAFPRAPTLQFPLSTFGVVALALESLGARPLFSAVGGALWAAGVVVFLGTLLWTIRDNPTGGETGTGEPNADRRPVDRVANAFVPLVLGYLAIGSYELVAPPLGLPPLLDGYPPRATHLLAAGTATLLVFAIGFRLLPRFLVASLPRPLVAVVLITGAIGPAVLAITLPAGRWFHLGAALEAVAVVGFAAAYLWLFATSDRRRIGFYGVLAGVIAGVAAAAIGLYFTVSGPTPTFVLAHARLNLLGFLGLTIVGVTFQFYPPNVGQFPGGSNRTAAAIIVLLSGGLALEIGGLVGGLPGAVITGRTFALVGSLAYALLLGGLVWQLGRR